MSTATAAKRPPQLAYEWLYGVCLRCAGLGTFKHLSNIEGGEREGPVHELNREKLHAGLRLMADPTKCPPRHLRAIVDETDDAETSDVLLQMALLGELRYG